MNLDSSEGRVAIEDYQGYYTEVRPHSGIGYRIPSLPRSPRSVCYFCQFLTSRA